MQRSVRQAPHIQLGMRVPIQGCESTELGCSLPIEPFLHGQPLAAVEQALATGRLDEARGDDQAMGVDAVRDARDERRRGVRRLIQD